MEEKHKNYFYKGPWSEEIQKEFENFAITLWCEGSWHNGEDTTDFLEMVSYMAGHETPMTRMAEALADVFQSDEIKGKMFEYTNKIAEYLQNIPLACSNKDKDKEREKEGNKRSSPAKNRDKDIASDRDSDRDSGSENGDSDSDSDRDRERDRDRDRRNRDRDRKRDRDGDRDSDKDKDQHQEGTRKKRRHVRGKRGGQSQAHRDAVLKQKTRVKQMRKDRREASSRDNHTARGVGNSRGTRN